MRGVRMRYDILRKAFLSVGVASVAIGVVSVPASAGVESRAIDTYKVWNGTDYVHPFGQPNTSTYGQTVVIPAGLHHVRKFKFWMAPNTGDGTILMRGEIYAWDGEKATGT